MLGPPLRPPFAPMFGAMLRPALTMGPLGMMLLARLLVVLARNGLLSRRLVTRFAMFAGLAMLARFLGVAARTATAIATAASTPAAASATPATTVARFERRGLEARHFDAGNGRADQLLDRLDQAAVGRRSEGEGMPGLAGTAGAADAMHVVLGRERHVEIEHMAHVNDV